jgi:small nuclear ribonucleoprotein (snRNP)-like protein
MSGVGAKRVKESIIDLSKYLDQPVTVKFAGGREGMNVTLVLSSSSCSRSLSLVVTGVLKGYDGLVNLVLDDCREYIQGVTRTRRTRNFLSPFRCLSRLLQMSTIPSK